MGLGNLDSDLQLVLCNCLLLAEIKPEPEVETKKPIRNQFNFGERSAQTLNQQMRDLGIQTQPPPRETISVTVNQ